MHWIGRHGRKLSSCWRRSLAALSGLPLRLKSLPRFFKAGAGAALLSLGWAPSLPAQDFGQATPGYVSLDEFSGSMVFTNDGGSYLLFDKMINNGPGVDDGYTRLGLRTTLAETPGGHFFGEVHGLITDHSRIGFNVGGGHRWLFGEQILGVHSWYDDYEAISGNRYQQIAFGAEYLSPFFDARANGYVPIGRRDNYVQLLTPGNEVLYFGNNIGTRGTGLFEASQTGFDIEGGVPVPMLDWARMYAGMYYLTANDLDTTGVRARAEARFTQGVNLNFIVQDDNRFGTNVNLNVEVRFSGAMPTSFGQPNTAWNRRYDQVRRTWAVQTLNYTDSVNVPMINPDTNRDWRITWVDNTTGPGNGTFENPLQGLPNQAPFSDLVLVRTGAGNTVGNINLVNNQQLLGEGTAHFINTDRLGVIQLPTYAFSDTGPAPTLVPGIAGQPVVTLANNNRVVNFDIDAPIGIVGTNITNFDLRRLNIDNANTGIRVTNGQGLGIIRDVTVDMLASGTGVLVTNNTRQPLTLDINRLYTTGGTTGLAVDALRSPVTLNVNNFSATGQTQTGLRLFGDRTELNGTFNNVGTRSTVGDGVDISLRGATGTATFNNLISSSNGRDGLRALANNNSNYNLNVIDSSLNFNGDDNLDTDALNGSTLNVFVDPTSLRGAGNNNWEFQADNGSTLRGTFLDVNLTGAGADAINGLVRNNSSVTLNLQRFSAAGAGQDGFDVTVQNGSNLVTNVANGSFAGAGQNGFSQNISNNSTSTLVINDAPINGAGNVGFLFNVQGGASGASAFNAIVNDVSFNNSGVNNVRGTVTQGSTANLAFRDVTASGGATQGGVDLIANTGGQIGFGWTGGNASLTGQDGLGVAVDGAGSRANVTLNGVVFNGNAGDGIDGQLTNGTATSNLRFNINNSIINGNAGNGVDYSIAGLNATGGVTFHNTQVQLNALDGFQFDVTGGADFTGLGSTAPNLFSGNGSNAIQGTVTGTSSTANLVIAGLQANNSGSTGVLLNASDNGLLNLDINNGVVNNSGVHGFDIRANTGGSINVDLNSVTVNNSRRNGVLFVAEDAGLVTLDMRGGSVSGNGTEAASSGVRGFALGAGSQASVHFDGTSANANTQHGFSFRAEDGATLIADLRTSGANGVLQASNNLGNGVNFTAVGAGTRAALVMEGANAFNQNGGHGIFANGTGVQQFAVGVSGNVNNNGGDGINISMNSVTSGAVQIEGAGGTIDGNGGEAVRLSFNNTNLGPIPVTTLTRTTTVGGMVLNGLDIDGAGGDGIHIDFLNTTIANGQGRISDTRVTNSGDDGVHLNFVNSTATGFVISGNAFESNTGNGLNIDALNSNLNGIQIIDNNLGGQSLASATFLIDGDPFIDPFILSNTSMGGVEIVGFTLNVAPSGNAFDTSGGGGVPFQPLLNSDVVTGLTTVNGNLITPGTNPLQDNLGNPLPGGGVPNNSTTLALGFNDFNPSETFRWEVDVDPAFNGASLAGSTVSITFSDGSIASGAVVTVGGNPNAGIFTTAGATIAGGFRMNDANGIRINLDNSTMQNAEIDRNVVSGNGESGINIIGRNGSTVSGSIAENAISANAQHGVLFDFDGSSLQNLTMAGNTIEQNQGDGIHFAFNNANLTNLAIQDNPTINNNSGSGINFQMVNSTINGLLIDNNGMGVAPPPPPVSLFNIDVVFGGGLTPSQQAVFANAAARWQEIIVGDVPDFGGVDDIVIFASGVPIDGPGGILGQAGPTGQRPVSFLPFSGIMQFDTADLAALESGGSLVDVILHEMAHVIGFGTIWDDLGLLVGGGTANPRFIGPLATAEHNARFGVTDTGVPVENTGGPGTRDSHWRESIYNNELMTGFLNPGFNPISRVTIAQWADLGYDVDYSTADPFLVAPSLSASALAALMQADPGDVTRPDKTVVTASQINEYAGLMPELVLGVQGLRQLAALQQNQLHGINISLTNTDLLGGEISGNIISGQATGNGIRLVNPTTLTGAAIELDINRNTISNNALAGIEIQLNGTTQLVSNIAGNTVNGNGGMGLSYTGRDSSNFNATFGGAGSATDANTFSGNVEAGVGLDLANTATAAVTLNNTTISNTTNDAADPRFGGDGLAVRLLNSARLTALNVDSSTFAGNNGSGIFVNALNQSQVDDLTVTDSGFETNGLQGIDIRRSSTATYSQGARGSIRLAGNSFIDNSATAGEDGIRLTFSGTNAPQPLEILENIFNRHQRGIALNGTQSARWTGSINDNEFFNISGEGINVDLSNSAALGNPLTPATPFQMLGNQFTAIGNAAIRVTTTDTAYANVVTGASAAQRMTVNGAQSALIVSDSGLGAVSAQFSMNGADISNVTQNGIQLNLNTGNRTVNISDVNVNSAGLTGVTVIANNNALTANISDLTVNGTGNDGLTIFNGTATGMNVTGSNINISNTSNQGIEIADVSAGNSTLNLTTVRVQGANNDGILINKTTGGTLAANLLDVQSIFNAGRGLAINATNNEAGRNVFNIGQIGGAQSSFSDNGGQGIQFTSRATSMDQTASAANTDVFVDAAVINPPVGQYVDPASRNLVVSTFNVLNALVQGNGNDGILLEVGSSTLVNSQLAGLVMGGNGSTDITITPIVSVNPPSSIDNPVGNDVLVFDPAARLDLILGSADTTGDGFAENTPFTHNSGTEISVAFAGANFTNPDVFKNNRAVQLAGQVQVQGLLNAPNNTFTKIITQDINALFSGQPFFNIVPLTFFPDNNP
jgi:hypothetical protein